MKETIFIGSDHAAFEVKKKLIQALQKDIHFEDCGSHDCSRVDYPDYAAKVAEHVSKGEGKGILLCGSGIGMSIAANKFPGVRAAVVWSEESGRLAREHNDANVLCLGARLLPYDVLLSATKAWYSAKFQGDRHQVRVELISRLERKR